MKQGMLGVSLICGGGLYVGVEAQWFRGPVRAVPGCVDLHQRCLLMSTALLSADASAYGGEGISVTPEMRQGLGKHVNMCHAAVNLT